jgi:hypothetical protein
MPSVWHTSAIGSRVISMHSLPPVLTIDDESSFAWGVFHERHPALVRRLLAAHPYAPEQRQALNALLDESRSGVVRPLVEDSGDEPRWRQWYQGHIGAPWAETPFLWAESYFYRRLLQAVEYFGPGAWQGVDLFGPFKAAELVDPKLDADFAALSDQLNMPVNSRPLFDDIMITSLYGNRQDLSFQLGTADGQKPDSTQLVADSRGSLWQYLNNHAPQHVSLVLDNAGRELLADLLLTDYLLRSGFATDVTLHVKPLPYYVSDATTTDVGDCLRRLSLMDGRLRDTGQRIQEAAAEGRLSIATHDFYCAPLSFHHMPKELSEDLGRGLAVFKGDLNYRRIVGDCSWEASASFEAASSYMPCPVVVLRTLKSDVIVGVEAALAAQLDESDPNWRSNGKHGLIQASLTD